MAWEWSHSQEAYQAVQNQLSRKAEAAENGDASEREWLLTICAEWDVKPHDGLLFDKWNRKYERFKKANTRLASEQGWQALADKIWELASDRATCDNGGWNAWMCPDGCHTLPFTDPEEENDGND